MKRWIVALVVLSGLVLACAGSPRQDPKPQPDGHKNVTFACARVPADTMCIEFYADEAAVLHIRADALRDDGQHATDPFGVHVMPVDQTINVFPGGGAVGFTVRLEGHVVTLSGKATGPKGILIGCRIVHRGSEVPEAGLFTDKGLAPCTYTGR